MELTTTFSKDSLLAIVRKNREKHIEMFAEAVKGWIEEGLEMHEKCILDLKAGVTKTTRIIREPPTSFASEYDLAIGMLEVSIDTVVTLSAHSFAQLAQDNWNWTQDWVMENSKFSPKITQYGHYKQYL